MKTNETIKVAGGTGAAAVPADRATAGWIAGQRKADPTKGDNRRTERTVLTNPVSL